MRIGIGRRIKEWRTARGLSQRQAAQGAGISQAEWQKLEVEDSKRIGLNTARHVVAYMGGALSLEDLAPKTRLPTPAPGPLPKAHEAR